jgi:hypothetical protein
LATPQPKVRKGSGPDQLPQGAASQLNAANPGEGMGEEDLLSAPAGPVAGMPPGMEDVGERLFAPTDRPNEPLTDGMPFGPGRNSVPPRGETEQQARTRTANELRVSPYQSPEVAEFISRLEKGQ